MLSKKEFIEKVSKIEQTFEDEFKAEYNSPELIWQRIIEPYFIKNKSYGIDYTDLNENFQNIINNIDNNID